MNSRLLILISLLTTACTPFGGFKPPPPYWQSFSAPKTSPVAVITALMECGYYHYPEFPGVPIAGQYTPSPKGNFAATQLCMQNSGFKIKGGSVCKTWAKNDSECQSDAIIPTRSIERRLNSSFCKTYPKHYLCQVVVIEPPPEPAKPVLPQPKSQYELERERNRMEQQRQQQQNDWLKRKGGF